MNLRSVQPQAEKAPSCGIMGAGRLGTALALVLYRHSLLWGVLCNSQAKADTVTELLPGIETYSSLEEVRSLPDYLFLTVRDNQLEALAAALARRFGTALAGRTVIHCSGALSLDLLEPCAANGARIIAAHPFQTFFDAAGDVFEGVAWGIECDSDCNDLKDLIILLGGKPFLLPPEARSNKSLYHISAVAASNFVVTTVAAANDLSRLAGIPAGDFLAPILHTTVQNCLRNLGQDGDIPLTGPIARGDSGTIRRHLEALGDHPHLLSIYVSLGMATAELCNTKDLLTQEKYNEIILVLKSAL